MAMDFDVQEQIVALAGNDECADCPASGPEWASVSLGTLICLDCAGIHRGLGVQVRNGNVECSVGVSHAAAHDAHS
jgi:hypothetical protein